LLYPLVCLAVWLRFAVLALGLSLGFRGDRIFRRAGKGKTIPAPDFSVDAERTQPPVGPEVGVLGGSSFVGRRLVPLLLQKKASVKAFSRQDRVSETPGLVWEKLESLGKKNAEVHRDWVSLCPLPVLVDFLPQLAASGARRLVAVSSTSRFTKNDSVDAAERHLASALAKAETAILDWAGEKKIEVVILRPTLVYDGIGDKNIAAVSAFIRKWKFFPVFAPASGLRQPLHVLDLAEACVSALSPNVRSGVYDVSGGETLSYREMVSRIFAWEGLPERIWEVPPWLVGLALPALRLLPRFRGLSAAVFGRMNENLVFDHGAAAEALGFQPRKFVAPVVLETAC
jgi:nucleoside-diphosphate-sugar epimerase